jgi:hypothetical protein
MHFSSIPADVLAQFRDGVVIPAQPLALDAQRRFDVRRQRALTRYYVDAGAGGLAVGVHTTQFAIRDVGLYRPVLEAAAQTVSGWTDRPLVMIAGVAGKTEQAVIEARTARALGYHAVLLSLAALKECSEDDLIEHCLAISTEMPLVGFYLQPAVGGMALGASFWSRFAAIENVIGIKGGAIQPLCHPGCDGRRRGGERGGSRHPLHRQRRSHRARPGDAIPNRAWRVAFCRRGCSATGRCGRRKP